MYSTLFSVACVMEDSHRPNLVLEDVNISFYISLVVQAETVFIHQKLIGFLLWAGTRFFLILGLNKYLGLGES